MGDKQPLKVGDVFYRDDYSIVINDIFFKDSLWHVKLSITTFGDTFGHGFKVTDIPNRKCATMYVDEWIPKILEIRNENK
jgi:hypothetical protein